MTVGLIAAAWLRRGEAAMGKVVRAVAAQAFRPLQVAVAVVTVAAGARRLPMGPARAVPAPPALPLLVHSVVRRGPPPRPHLRPALALAV